MTRAAKRSRTSRQPPPSNFPINKLPDILLVEVLCRLPDIKQVHRYKRVSKRWCTLLSDPYFVGRFLRVQHDLQTPLRYAYAMLPNRDRKLKASVITTSSQPPYPMVDNKISMYSFLPCFQDPFYDYKGDEFAVAGTYNDLVLCSPTKLAQCDYYICNTYTKEWVRLPPTPRVKEFYVPVGFICDPYYSTKEDGTSSNSSIIKVNAEYRCRVVRLLPDEDNKGFSVEIYSSETGEWREYQLSKVLSSQKNDVSFSGVRRCTGVACNGKLYWWNNHGFIFELDPFNITSDSNIIDTCRFIDAPALDIYKSEFRHIGVCQGRLRMCTYWLRVADPVKIWELKENQVHGKPEWHLICDRVSLSQMVHKPPLKYDQGQTCITQVIGFHPDDGDILYLQFPAYIVKCNVREKTLEGEKNKLFYESGLSYTSYQSHRESYPFVFPWWPTPIKKRLHYCEDYNVNLTGKYNLSMRLSFLTTLKRLKTLLGEDELYFDELLLGEEDDNMQLRHLGIGEDSEIHVIGDCWRQPARRKRKTGRL